MNQQHENIFFFPSNLNKHKRTSSAFKIYIIIIVKSFCYFIELYINLKSRFANNRIIINKINKLIMLIKTQIQFQYTFLEEFEKSRVWLWIISIKLNN